MTNDASDASFIAEVRETLRRTIAKIETAINSARIEERLKICQQIEEFGRTRVRPDNPFWTLEKICDDLASRIRADVLPTPKRPSLEPEDWPTMNPEDIARAKARYEKDPT